MSMFGIFSDKNRDYSEFSNENVLTEGGRVHILERRKYAQLITKDGVNYYKYDLTVPINHGLARQEKPLPSGTYKSFFF